jgi:hypothetical protein
MSQVHKEQLSAVDNALPNRSSLDIEIFGMEGVPEDVIQAHNQRVLTQYQQAEAERRAATGNPPPGATAEGNQPKKPKLEISDLKKRLAEHKAKATTEKTASGGSSGDVTPVGAGQTTQTTSVYVSLDSGAHLLRNGANITVARDNLRSTRVVRSRIVMPLLLIHNIPIHNRMAL